MRSRPCSVIASFLLGTHHFWSPSSVTRYQKAEPQSSFLAYSETALYGIRPLISCFGSEKDLVRIDYLPAREIDRVLSHEILEKVLKVHSPKNLESNPTLYVIFPLRESKTRPQKTLGILGMTTYLSRRARRSHTKKRFNIQPP